MKDKEAIERIIKALDSIKPSWIPDYRQGRLLVIAKGLLSDIKKLGYRKINKPPPVLNDEELQPSNNLKEIVTSLAKGETSEAWVLQNITYENRIKAQAQRDSDVRYYEGK